MTDNEVMNKENRKIEMKTGATGSNVYEQR